jgi:hypothetical protein
MILFRILSHKNFYLAQILIHLELKLINYLFLSAKKIIKVFAWKIT